MKCSDSILHYRALPAANARVFEMRKRGPPTRARANSSIQLRHSGFCSSMDAGSTTLSAEGSILCCAHSSRALNVVRNGSSESLTSTEAPRDSLTMDGEAPGIRASFGILKRSPLPLSTYAPGSLIDSHVTSVSASLRTACADWVMVSSFGLGMG